MPQLEALVQAILTQGVDWRHFPPTESHALEYRVSFGSISLRISHHNWDCAYGLSSCSGAVAETCSFMGYWVTRSAKDRQSGGKIDAFVSML